MLAWVVGVTRLALSSARVAWAAAIDARSALTEAVVDGEVSVASTKPILTTWPELAKFRFVTPLLLTVPVNERPSAVMILGTYQIALARQTATIKTAPRTCGPVI